MVEEGTPGVSIFGALGTEALAGPGHVGEQMAGLHGGDDAEAGEAVEGVRGDDLGVFNAEAKITRMELRIARRVIRVTGQA